MNKYRQHAITHHYHTQNFMHKDVRFLQLKKGPNKLKSKSSMSRNVNTYQC